jgi:hypothetical protein
MSRLEIPMPVWTRHLSNDLRLELLRIRNGSKLERQRYRNAEDAIATVLMNPTTPRNLNHSLGQYRAADVLAQYRIFYEIISNETVIHFVWINDEKYLHDSSKNPDPCYDRFLTLVNTKRIPAYIAPIVVVKPLGKASQSFNLKGKWGASPQIYATLADARGQAISNLVMQSLNKTGCYQIVAINATVEKLGLEEALLNKVAIDARKNGIKLYHELDLNADPVHVALLKQIFLKCGFKMTTPDTGSELWET